jgi:hypothetical protein
MNDVTPVAEKRFMELMMSRTPGERVAMACRMFGTAKALIIAGLRSEGIEDERVIRRRVFLALHGSDFTEEQQRKIIAHLESKSAA